MTEELNNPLAAVSLDDEVSAHDILVSHGAALFKTGVPNLDTKAIYVNFLWMVQLSTTMKDIQSIRIMDRIETMVEHLSASYKERDCIKLYHEDKVKLYGFFASLVLRRGICITEAGKNVKGYNSARLVVKQLCNVENPSSPLVCYFIVMQNAYRMYISKPDFPINLDQFMSSVTSFTLGTKSMLFRRAPGPHKDGLKNYLSMLEFVVNKFPRKSAEPVKSGELIKPVSKPAAPIMTIKTVRKPGNKPVDKRTVTFALPTVIAVAFQPEKRAHTETKMKHEDEVDAHVVKRKREGEYQYSEMSVIDQVVYNVMTALHAV